MNNILLNLSLAANEIFKDNKVLRDLCVAQGIHESNLYGNPSKLASKYKNLFGIKKAGTAGVVDLGTWEEEDHKIVHLKQLFGVNKTYRDSVLQYKQVLDLPRYDRARRSADFKTAATLIQACGYATDSHYPAKLLVVYQDPRFPKN